MDKLDQAIILILSGDEQSGQRLLGEVVTVESQNDVAWFWLASVAPLEKRIDYLERVLHINPAHAQARAKLAQLRPVIPVQIAPQPIIGTPEYWNFPVKQGLRVILLQGENLITFLVTQDRLALVLSQVRQVVMTKEWYFANIALGTQDATYQSIPFVQMTQARLFGVALPLRIWMKQVNNARPKSIAASTKWLTRLCLRCKDTWEMVLNVFSRPSADGSWRQRLYLF